ncbi:glycogen debranching protein [Actinoplanes sp. NPDC023936]|uniref:amylo-alpha-1,6-glucosidase n=1 Tax=Actinoplanes sp. NPDC023936 TaxID=3154910 RepID=UPI0033FED6E8
MRFSIRDIPFSCRGSWFGISPVIAENTVAGDLHLVSHQTGMHPVLRFAPSEPAAVTATPALLSWDAGAGRIELAYRTPDTVRIRGDGLGLRIVAAAATLTPFSGTYLYQDPADGSAVFTSYETGRRYRVTVLSGSASVSGAEALGEAERAVTLPAGSWEVAIEEYETGRPPYEATRTTSATPDFAAFADAVAPWRSPETPAAELAAYVLWSATVAPAGFVTRPAVLMSKHWMDKVWSWDHCFNAIALAAGEPGLAWDQFQLPFDHQDASGALPDSITHSEVLHNFVKPPIHGWALRRLMPADDAERARAYQRLTRWTRFWLDARRAPGAILPHYTHGNDSGWDNATTFDGGRVIQSADLAAFLVLQLRCLAEMGAGDEAAEWARIGDEIRDAMIRDLWTGDRFEARDPRTGERRSSSSLLDLMPIVLGEELPEPIATRLAERIEDHLTGYGLATEPLDSPHHAADGYWRGPIWAPSTVLIEDGLRRAGFTGLADEVSRQFRALCERSGFAENFDARTGEGLRDRAYTWTASGYLILASAYEKRRAAGPVLDRREIGGR